MIIQILSQPLAWSYHETSHETVGLVVLSWYVLIASSREDGNSYPSSRALTVASSEEYRDKYKLKRPLKQNVGKQGVLQKFEPIPILSDFRYIPSVFSDSKSTVATLQSSPCLGLPRQQVPPVLQFQG